MPTFEEKKREVDSNSPKEDDNLGILEYGESMFSVKVENGNRTIKRSVDSRSGLMPSTSTSSLETLAATPASPLRWRLKARPNWMGFDTTFANTPPARSMSATLPLPMSPISKRRISIVESPGRFTAEVLLDMNNSVIEEANLNNSENR